MLTALHDAITANHGLRFRDHAAVIVHLGDYVDRGPDSRGVIEKLMTLQAEASCADDLEVICLKGNHEQMMVDAIDDGGRSKQSHWMMNGGLATLQSYACEEGEYGVDQAHVEWLRDLPNIHIEHERGLVFVHAGIAPAQFPNCPEEVRLWTRARAFTNDAAWPEREELAGLRVVHGHTPTDDWRPEETERRINVDTGACFGGALTAAVIAPNRPVEYLYAVHSKNERQATA